MKKIFVFVVDRYKILPSGNLHIIDVQQSDSGKYQCSAKNPLTSEIVNNSQITILQVLKKPSNSRERQPLSTVCKPPVASR
jgi:membrane-bound inhibitor of C-type lysozyme